MKAKRLQFANNHQRWTAQEWQNVLFSDESTFQQFVVRKSYVRRPPGKRFDDRYTISSMKHPPSQMVWGAMCRNGVAVLSVLPPGTTINGSKYVQMLSEKLKNLTCKFTIVRYLCRMAPLATVPKLQRTF